MTNQKSFTKIDRSKKNSRHPDEAFIYESLLLLNLHARAIGEIIIDLSAEGVVLKNEAAYFKSMLEEARASLSQNVVEAMDTREIKNAAGASKRRLGIEKKIFET